MLLLYHCAVSPSNKTIEALLQSETVEKDEDITCEGKDGELLHLDPEDARICDGVNWDCKEGRDERSCDFHTPSDFVLVTISDQGKENNNKKIQEIVGAYAVVRDEKRNNTRFYQHSEGQSFIHRKDKKWTISINNQKNGTETAIPTADNKNLTSYFFSNDESEALPEVGWKDGWDTTDIIRVSLLPKSINRSMLLDVEDTYEKSELQTEWILCTTKMTDPRHRLFISNATSTKEKKCDRTWDCEDGTDEKNCGQLAAETLYPSVLATSTILLAGCLVQMIRALHKRIKRQGCCKRKKRRIPRSPKVTSRENPNARLAQNAVDNIIGWVLKSAKAKKENKIENESKTITAEKGTPFTEESSSGASDQMNETDSAKERDALYQKLHRIDGGVRLLTGTGFRLLSTPTERHILADFIFTTEKKLHDDDDEKALRCMRTKGNSTREMAICVDNVRSPGCLKKTEHYLIEKPMNWIFGESNCFAKCVAAILIGASPVIKMSFYTFDFSKDTAMASYLYFQRWTYIGFPTIHGLIVLYGLSIVASSATMCLMIQSTSNNGIVNLNKIEKGFLRRIIRILLFVLSPTIPLSILVKSVRLTMKMKVLVANWRNNKSGDSPSAAWMEINALEQKKKKVNVALSQMKCTEANLEGNVQLFVLVCFYFIPMRLQNSGLGSEFEQVSEFNLWSNEVDYMDTVLWILLVVSPILTLVSNLMATISAIDISKGRQLGLKSKLVLGLYLAFQLGSHLFR